MARPAGRHVRSDLIAPPGLQQAGCQELRGFGQTRPGPHQDVRLCRGKCTDPALLHGAQLRPARPSDQIVPALTADDDHIGLGSNHEFTLNLRKRPEGSRQDIDLSQAAERLADEGRLAGPVRTAAHLDIKLLSAQRLRQALGRGRHRGIHLAPDRMRLPLRQTEDAGQSQQISPHIFMGARLQGQNRHAQRTQTLLSRTGDCHEHQIRSLGHHSLEIDIETAAHAGQRLYGSRPIGIAIHAHQALALPQGTHRLGKSGQQADHPPGRLRQAQLLLQIIAHCDSLSPGHSRSQYTGRHQARPEPPESPRHTVAPTEA